MSIPITTVNTVGEMRPQPHMGIIAPYQPSTIPNMGTIMAPSLPPSAPMVPPVTTPTRIPGTAPHAAPDSMPYCWAVNKIMVADSMEYLREAHKGGFVELPTVRHIVTMAFQKG